MNHIHGHEVMHMMAKSSSAYSRAALEAAIHEEFGKSTRFFTCSAEGMTALELISFLEQKGKFHLMDEGFSLAPEKICQH